MEPILTLDIDWAPDWVIEQVSQILIERQVKTTWFVTHHSKALQYLREHADLFELGIHPNLLAGTTHGANEDEVLAYLREIVPEAVSMRTHGLYQTTNFLTKANLEYNIDIDVSLFLPRTAHLVPHRFTPNNANLLRIPYFWEDDFEMFNKNPAWDLSDPSLQVEGYRIFDFHPIHIVLNLDRFDRYCDLKKERPLSEWNTRFVENHRNRGKGTGTLFMELTAFLSGKGKRIKEFNMD